MCEVAAVAGGAGGGREEVGVAEEVVGVVRVSGRRNVVSVGVMLLRAVARLIAVRVAVVSAVTVDELRLAAEARLVDVTRRFRPLCPSPSPLASPLSPLPSCPSSCRCERMRCVAGVC